MAIRVVIAIMLTLVVGGCGQLRLPAIDPTGSRLFSPLPTTTTLALPCMDGSCLNCLQSLPECNCLRSLGSCLTTPALAFPTPAFPPAVDPPACPTAAAGVCPATNSCGCGDDSACVASTPCCGDCLDGPRAVLLGTQTDCGKRHCGLPTCLGCGKLPDRGKRGCILLTPQKIVAPVGGEVVLLSGICGTDGYLQMNEPLEWMLSPDSVGNIIAVGDDEPGLVGRLAGSKIRPEKRDPSYAIGVTSTKRSLITRGNNNPADDVRLEKGQTWLTLSSPSEGTCRVTVVAPESECWDQRKATATIYWVDARWTFPQPQRVPVDTTVEMTTMVNRAEGGLPAAGWIVRYEIVDPSLASLSTAGGPDVMDVNVDDAGRATVRIVPRPGAAGTTPVNISIIRPGGLNDRLPKLTLGSGQSAVTWSAPGLQLRAGGPSTATYATPFEVVANLSNPGDQTATNVRVEMQVPAGCRVIRADSFAIVTPQSVSWDIGSLPAKSQLDLFVTLESQNPVAIPFTARGDGLSASDSVRVDVFRPALALTVAPEQPSAQSGSPVRFNVDITNTGDRPLTDVTWLATGSQTLLHEGGDTAATNTKSTPLNPGETWPVVVTFVPNAAGRQCINVNATAAGGQRSDAQSCVTVINPIPRAPRLSIALEPRSSTFVGDRPTLHRLVVVNDGDAPATSVRTNIVFDPALQLSSATEGSTPLSGSGGGLQWTTPRLDPGQSLTYEMQLSPVAANPATRITARTTSQEGSRDEDSITVAIEGIGSPSDRGRATPLPPAVTPPTIPGGPAPLQGDPRGSAGLDRASPPPANLRSGDLRMALIAADNPVRVGQPIRYSLTIENDSDVTDSEVDVQVTMPDGVQFERIVPTTNPELSQVEFDGDRVLLPLIRTLRPGESVEYVLLLSSNQPQVFDLDVTASSRNRPGTIVANATTTVVP